MEIGSALEVLGVVGIGVSVAAYIPQAVHLWREHCSAGVSSRAWTMWLISSLLVGILAVYRGEMVFIALQACTLASASLILLLAHRYRGMACDGHIPTTSSEPDAHVLVGGDRVELPTSRV